MSVIPLPINAHNVNILMSSILTKSSVLTPISIFLTIIANLLIFFPILFAANVRLAIISILCINASNALGLMVMMDVMLVTPMTFRSVLFVIVDIKWVLITDAMISIV